MVLARGVYRVKGRLRFCFFFGAALFYSCEGRFFKNMYVCWWGWNGSARSAHDVWERNHQLKSDVLKTCLTDPILPFRLINRAHTLLLPSAKNWGSRDRQHLAYPPPHADHESQASLFIYYLFYTHRYYQVTKDTCNVILSPVPLRNETNVFKKKTLKII